MRAGTKEVFRCWAEGLAGDCEGGERHCGGGVEAWREVQRKAVFVVKRKERMAFDDDIYFTALLQL